MENYNGWKNHATWCVALHLSNTPHTNDAVIEICNRHEDEYDALQELRDYVYENIDRTHSEAIWGEWDWLASDLMHAYLQEVDFLQIVQHNKNQ
jgi:hypothetical protein